MNGYTYHKTWDDEIVKRYITQESQEKSPDVFLETHLPITHIEAETLIGGDSQFITEEQLLEHIGQSSVETGKNRIYLLKGEVGSGKSHLCQWMEYQLNGTEKTDPYDDEHVAIHISRNNTRLADILDKLYEHVDAEHDDIDDITEYDDYPKVVDTLLSMLDTFDADLQFDDDVFDFKEFIADSSSGTDLREVVIENLQDYRKSVEAEEKEQEFELLTREQFRNICFDTFSHGFGGERGDDIYPKVRLAINERLMTNLGIENFQQDLEEISAQYKEEGKRPVLICEDVTTFNVLKDDLLDHIFELGDGSEGDHGFDIVLGYTTGWEQEKADDALTTGDLSFMVERAQGYLSMTDREGRAYFLQQGSMPVRLVDRYLEVIKEHSDVVPPREIDEDAFDGMYPFNKRFIVRAHRNLQEDGDTQQTPRLLLYHVIHDALLSDVPPFTRTADNTHLEDFAAPMSVQGLSSEFQRLVKWYGRMDGGKVVMSADIPESFDVPIPEDVTVENEEVRLEAMYGAGGWEVAEDELEGFDPAEFMEDPDGTISDPDTRGDDDGESDEDGDGPTVVEPDDGDDDETDERRKRIGQFQNWYGTGGEFPSSNRLTEGVQAALNRFYDATRLANENATTTGKAGFYYTRGDDVPVTIVGPDEQKSITVDVHFKDNHEQLYLNLFQRGIDGEFPSNTNFDSVRGWCDEKVLSLRQQMRGDLEACLPDDDLPSGFVLEDLLVLTQVFIHNARTGRIDIDREDVLSVPEYAETSPFYPDSNRFDIPSGLNEAASELNKRRSDVKSLCEGFFLFKESFIDDGRLTNARRNVTENLDAYIDAAARISASDLPKAYRIGSSRSDASGSGSTVVKSFFKTVSDYANEVQKLERDFDGTQIEEDIDAVRSLHSYDHTAADLVDIYQRLKQSFAPLDDSLESDWTDVGEKLEDGSLTLNLSDFGETLQESEVIDPDNGLEAIAIMHEYNESRESQDAWRVYQIFAEMIERIELHDEAEGSTFANDLRETSEFKSYQSNRDKTVKTLEGI